MTFKRETKMRTSEPSDDEAKMKKGGRLHKAIGGGLPAGRITGALPPALSAQMAAAAPRGRAALLASRMPARPSPGSPVMPAKKGGKMAEGGKMESAAEERKEEREIKDVKSELKKHESEKASKAHKGLKAGGLLGGVEDYKAHGKGETEGVEGLGYKRGGKMHKAEGGSVKTTKVVGVAQKKSISSKTSGVEGAGYCDGGKMKKYASGGSVKTTKVVNDAHPRDVSGKTGSIKQDPAGYKRGGSVRHKADGGHVESVKGHADCGHTAMKRGGSW